MDMVSDVYWREYLKGFEAGRNATIVNGWSLGFNDHSEHDTYNSHGYIDGQMEGVCTHTDPVAYLADYYRGAARYAKLYGDR
jgi:hypothetical protein